MKPTPIYELRKPHPNQARIDAESAALLRATEPQSPPSIEASETGLPRASTHQITAQPQIKTHASTTGRLKSS